MTSATLIATKTAMAGHAAGLVGTLIPTAVPSDGLLSLAGIDLSREAWPKPIVSLAMVLMLLYSV